MQSALHGAERCRGALQSAGAGARSGPEPRRHRQSGPGEQRGSTGQQEVGTLDTVSSIVPAPTPDCILNIYCSSAVCRVLTFDINVHPSILLLFKSA